MGAFGEALTQSLQQQQQMGLQRQHLKLQRDIATTQMKHMDLQNQMSQLQLQRLMQHPQLAQQLFGMPGQQPQEVSPGVPPLQAGGEAVPASFGAPGAILGQRPPTPSRLDVSRPTVTGQPSPIAAQFLPADELSQFQTLAAVDPESAIKAYLTRLGEGAKFEKVGPGEVGGFYRGGRPVGAPITGGPPKPQYGDAVNAELARIGKTPQTATPEEIGKATDAVDARLLKRSQEQGLFGAQLGLAKQQKELLSSQEANELGVPYGTTREEAKGIQPITPHQRESLAAFDTARGILNDIEQYAKLVPDVKPGVIGKTYGSAKNYIAALSQSDPNAALLVSKAGELSQVARAMGERGTLATADISRAAGLIPLVTDTMTVRKRKMKDLRAFFDNSEQAVRQSLRQGAPSIQKPGQAQQSDIGQELSSGKITLPQAKSRLMRERGYTEEQATWYLEAATQALTAR